MRLAESDYGDIIEPVTIGKQAVPAAPATPASPTVDGRAALAKLTGGNMSSLTNDERAYLGLPVTPATTDGGTDGGDNGDGKITGEGNEGDGQGEGEPGGSGSGNKPVAEITLVSTEKDDYGNTVGYYSDGTSKILLKSGNKYKSTVDEDAYAILEQTFKDYGLEDLVPVIKGFMDQGLGQQQAALELRKNDVYQKRFAGNTARRDAGLNVLSEGEYLALENAYTETLQAYGLANQFGTDRKAKQAAMANLIGGDVAATEFKDRIDTVVTRVNNADPTIKATLTSFFDIKDSDLVSYFLNPKEGLPKLQEKVTAAEIGAAAKGQNLATSAAAATALAQFGVTKAEAQKGYATIGEVLPTASFLGDIYGDKYTQATAEEEVFKGTASAARKRQQLAEREQASFLGSSGRLRTGQQQGNAGKF